MIDLDQPSPRPGRDVVYPHAVRAFVEMSAHQVDKGLRTHGTPLETFNGRDAYQDFLQEQVDGLMYATQLRLEGRRFADLVSESVSLMSAIQRYIDGDDHDVHVTIERIDAYLREAKSCIEQSGLAISAASVRADSRPEPSNA